MMSGKNSRACTLRLESKSAACQDGARAPTLLIASRDVLGEVTHHHQQESKREDSTAQYRVT